MALTLGLLLALGLAVFPARGDAAGLDGMGFVWHHKKKPAEQPPKPEAPKASQPAAFTIPVEPLGFVAPSSFYEGLRERLVSLDFLDENRLLFTFRAPGLIRRHAGAGGDERQVRAMLLSLPAGSVDAQSLWTLHDTDPYLWMLKDGHFLLRDRDNLAKGDATLGLRPYLTFPGPLLWLEMDPDEQYLVTDSREPEGAAAAGTVPSPEGARAEVTTDDGGSGPQSGGLPEIVLRILERKTGKVMLVSRVRMRVHLPMNAEGYVEVLQSTDRDWVLNLRYFTGGSRILGKVASQCSPQLQFVTDQEMLATTCDTDGSLHLVAIGMEGRRLWDAGTPETEVWPIVVARGGRVARETLEATHPVGPYSPLSFEDVKGQRVRVYNAADGKVVLTAEATPVLDGGGNVAISPSGRRVAVLQGGSIAVYELPAAPKGAGAGKGAGKGPGTGTAIGKQPQ